MKAITILIIALLSAPAAAQTAPATGGVRQNEATVLMPVNDRQRQFQESWGLPKQSPSAT